MVFALSGFAGAELGVTVIDGNTVARVLEADAEDMMTASSSKTRKVCPNPLG